MGLDLALEEETKKWFPVSNSSKEVRGWSLTLHTNGWLPIVRQQLNQGGLCCLAVCVAGWVHEARERRVETCWGRPALRTHTLPPYCIFVLRTPARQHLAGSTGMFWYVRVDSTFTLFQHLQVRDKLIEACRARGVTFRYNASVEGLRPLVSEQPEQQQPQQQQIQQVHEQQEAIPEAEPQQLQQQEQLQPPVQAIAESGQGEAEAGAGGEGEGRQRRKGKGRGKGRGRREGAGSDSEAEEEERRRRAVRWVCRLQDGTEHVTDKVVGGAAWGGRASMFSQRRMPGSKGCGSRGSYNVQRHATEPWYAATTWLGGWPPATLLGAHRGWATYPQLYQCFRLPQYVSADALPVHPAHIHLSSA